MLKLLAVGVGGFLGAVARYGLSGWVHRYAGASFPAGTLAVNVFGCFLIGVLMTLVEDRPLLSPETRMFLTVGLLGSFTTFSTVAFETFEMLRDRNPWVAGLNVAANLLVGLGAVWLGRAAVRALGG